MANPRKTFIVQLDPNAVAEGPAVEDLPAPTRSQRINSARRAAHPVHAKFKEWVGSNIDEGEVDSIEEAGVLPFSIVRGGASLKSRLGKAPLVRQVIEDTDLAATEK